MEPVQFTNTEDVWCPSCGYHINSQKIYLLRVGPEVEDGYERRENCPSCGALVAIKVVLTISFVTKEVTDT